MRISDWSSDVCSSDLNRCLSERGQFQRDDLPDHAAWRPQGLCVQRHEPEKPDLQLEQRLPERHQRHWLRHRIQRDWPDVGNRSEEHTSELQSLMRISYAVFCLKNKTPTTPTQSN